MAIAKPPPPAARAPASPLLPAAPPGSARAAGTGKQAGRRIAVLGVEGVGKTTFGAYAEKPLFLCARGESGIDTLASAGLVPAVSVIECPTWEVTLATLADLVAGCDYRTIVLDAMSGFERLCHETVCVRDFDGIWGEKGFSSFMRGYETSVPEWLRLLVVLDKIREVHAVDVLLLSHCQVRPHRNPIGPDYDRYVSDCHPKTWAPTAKWCDAVLFYSFVSVIQQEKGRRAKAIGGQDRLVRCERSDAWDAKNRYGMPAEIDVPNDPARAWSTVVSFMKGGADAR